MDAASIRNTGVNAASGREAAGSRAAASDPDTQRALQDLRNRDREVHAQEIGTDGRAYAVGGEVRIDTAPVQGDPAATVDKMGQVARTAMAPADPSPQDMAVAQEARGHAARAWAEVTREKAATGPVQAFAEVEAMDDAELMRRGGRLDLFV